MSLNHTWINMNKVNENIISNTNSFIVTTSFWILHALYLVSEFDTLVRIVRKLLAWNKSTGSLLSLQLAFLVHHAPLTHHQSRAASALQTLKDVVFASLCAGGGECRTKKVIMEITWTREISLIFHKPFKHWHRTMSQPTPPFQLALYQRA